ncbi:MAG: hypothetical protein FWE86_03220 [Oscillospiraceae bacterium]|nr:hypothetical protein [Oscillospiraceae bacterium]
MQILIIVTLLLIAAALAFIMGYKIDKTLALACFVCIITVYIFGLAGIMAAGAYACLALGVLCLIYLVRRTVKEGWRTWRELILTPGFSAFCLLAVVFVWWTNRGRMLFIPDEFSHWGAVVKAMCAFDGFGSNPDGNLIFPGYPPGTALFQYLWVKLCGQFDESLLYRAMNFLLLSLVIPFFSGIEWAQKKAVLPLVGVVTLIPLLFFADYYSSLMVDAALGGVMGYALLMNFQSVKLDRRLTLSISAALFVLTLIKASGFGLALIAAGIIFADRFRKPQKGELLIVLAPIFANLSWKIHINAAQTRSAWPGMKKLTGEAVKDFLTGRGEWRYQAVAKFFGGILERPVYTDFLGRQNATAAFSAFHWALILASVALAAFFAAQSREEKHRIRRAVIAMLAGGALYACSLEILYLFTFSAGEALVLASFERYIGSFILGCILPMCYLALRSVSLYHNPAGRFMPVAAGVLAIVLCFTVDVGSFAKEVGAAPSIVAAQSAERIGPKQLAAAAPPLDYRKDGVWVVDQSLAETDWSPYPMMIYYEFTPVRSAVYVMGESLDGNRYRTIEFDPEIWRNNLRGNYSYVYLLSADEQFRQDFSEMFENPEEIEDDVWFSVADGGENLMLRKIENK